MRLLSAAFLTFHDDGLLLVEDPDRSAAQFAYAAVGPLQDRALLTGDTPSAPTVERFASGAARDFYAAHRPG